MQVRWDSNKGFHVPELSVRECVNVIDMLQVGGLHCSCPPSGSCQQGLQGQLCSAPVFGTSQDIGQSGDTKHHLTWSWWAALYPVF